MLVVADSSPLIYPTRIGLLEVLASTFGDVVVGLDPGETAAILLAEAIEADLLLLDERAGRAVALERGLAVRGTLGVLVQARQAGALPPLRPVLDALVAEGFRLAPALVEEALRRVGEA